MIPPHLRDPEPGTYLFAALIFAWLIIALAVVIDRIPSQASLGESARAVVVGGGWSPAPSSPNGLEVEPGE